MDYVTLKISDIFLGKANDTTGLIHNTEIHIGEWCVFNQGENVKEKIMVGLIVSFCYTDGKTLKTRAFTKTVAEVQSERAIGILGTWFMLNDEGRLLPKPISKKKKHEFIPIRWYRATIEKPTFNDKILHVTANVLEAIKSI